MNVNEPATIPECEGQQSRKVLYRAGHMAQMAFLLVRELVFDQRFESIEKVGHNINLQAVDYDILPLIAPFPDSKFHNELDREAVLTHKSGNCALITLQRMILAMLKDIDTHFVEIVVVPEPNLQHLFIREFDDGGNPLQVDEDHEALLVFLENSETYVLDVASAQYGHLEGPVIPLAVYVTRIQAIKSFRDMGAAVQDSLARAEEDGKHATLAKVYNEFAMQLMNAIERWESKNLPLYNVLQRPEVDFQILNFGLFECLKQKLTDHKTSLEKNGLHWPEDPYSDLDATESE